MGLLHLNREEKKQNQILDIWYPVVPIDLFTIAFPLTHYFCSFWLLKCNSLFFPPWLTSCFFFIVNLSPFVNKLFNLYSHNKNKCLYKQCMKKAKHSKIITRVSFRIEVGLKRTLSDQLSVVFQT